MTRLVFADTETNGTHHDRRAWEVAAIVRPDGGTRDDDTEHEWLIDIDDIDLEGADPVALDIGRFWQRHPQANPNAPRKPAFREWEVLQAVADLTAGKARVLGSNPAFDTYTLGPRMEAYGITPDWHYHPDDVPGIALGWLYGAGKPVPESRKSDAISLACGVDPARYDRHSALGDCQWGRDLYDKVTGHG